MTFAKRIDQIINECSELSYDQLRFKALRSYNTVLNCCKNFFSTQSAARESLLRFMIFFAILDNDIDEDEFRLIEYVYENIDFYDAVNMASSLSIKKVYDSYCDIIHRLPDYEAAAMVELCACIMFSDGGLTRKEYDFIKSHA